MFDRYIRRIGPAFFAALGSKHAKGEIRFLHAQDYLRDEWNVYRGEQRVQATVTNIANFMMDRFGADIGVNSFDHPGTLNREQLDEVFEELARMSLAQGLLVSDS